MKDDDRPLGLLGPKVYAYGSHDHIGNSLNFSPMLPRHLQHAVRRQCLHARPPPPRYFHASARRFNEPPKSPFQTFVDVLKDELRKNRELQDNVKQLQGDVDKLQDSETMKRARAAYERARVQRSSWCIFAGYLQY